MTEYEAFAVELAREAARVTLPFFRSDIGHEDKGGAAGFDPVTYHLEGGPLPGLPEHELTYGGAVWRFADGARPGGEGTAVTIGIRPEHLIADGAEGLALTVELAEPLGSETVLHGRLPDGTPLTARVPGAAAAESVSLSPDPAALHVFDATSGRRIDPAH